MGAISDEGEADGLTSSKLVSQPLYFSTRMPLTISDDRVTRMSAIGRWRARAPRSHGCEATRSTLAAAAYTTSCQAASTPFGHTVRLLLNGATV
jgi:hypothetical protein